MELILELKLTFGGNVGSSLKIKFTFGGVYEIVFEIKSYFWREGS
jgi:hypothetical protein